MNLLQNNIEMNHKLEIFYPNDDISLGAFKNNFYQIVPEKEELTLEQKEILSEFASSLAQVDLGLHKFLQLTSPVSYSLALNGDAILYFLTNQFEKIKSLDIHVCFLSESYEAQDPQSPYFNDDVIFAVRGKQDITNKNIRQQLEDKYQPPLLINGSNIAKRNKLFQFGKEINKLNNTYILTHLCESILSESFNVQSIEQATLTHINDYWGKSFYGSLSIAHTTLKYPLKLHIHHRPFASMINSHRIHLKGIGIFYDNVNYYGLEHLKLDKSFSSSSPDWENAYDALRITSPALSNLVYKDISVDASNITEDFATILMEKYYQPMKSKFHDYSLAITHFNGKFNIDILEQIAFKIDLDLTLPSKSANLKKNKI